MLPSVLAVCLAACEQMPDVPNMDTVHVDLFAPIREQSALPAWPTRGDGSLRDIFALQEPHMLALHLGERSFTAASRLTFLKQDAGALTAVSVQPPERPAPYEQMLADLETLLREQDLLTPELQAKLRDWRAQPPEDDAFPPPPARTARARYDTFAVFVSVRQEAGGQWFYTLEFERSAPRPPRRRIG